MRWKVGTEKYSRKIQEGLEDVKIEAETARKKMRGGLGMIKILEREKKGLKIISVH